MKPNRDWLKHVRQIHLFNCNVWRLLLVVRGLLGMLVILIVVNGFAIAYFEDIAIADSLYFAFITAFTIGYGDIAPVTVEGRIMAVLTGLVGLIFTGLIIAISTRALAQTVEDVRKKEKKKE